MTAKRRKPEKRRVDRYGWRRRCEVCLPSVYGVAGYQSVMREFAPETLSGVEMTDALAAYLDATLAAMDTVKAWPDALREHERAVERLHKLCGEIDSPRVTPGNVDRLEQDLAWVRADNARLVSAVNHLNEELAKARISRT